MQTADWCAQPQHLSSLQLAPASCCSPCPRTSSRLTEHSSACLSCRGCGALPSHSRSGRGGNVDATPETSTWLRSQQLCAGGMYPMESDLFASSSES